ncbi:MAG: membrane protein containing APHP [Candidatus Syntrophoarchaeum caldarius]|uniref:Membrane protein containing APHP n=1 Tax=Candidatus Syntropharchaeum caldarium TaxID=1838285 RepID=A0A1F2P9N2_9EURY|nr:MAG: membrane protein containing APHP [Candidatus Syntrophoarchaeum caldarius]
MIQMGKVIAVIGLILLITSTITVSTAGSHANIVITDVTPVDLSPGDTRDITLTIKNDGSRDARHITLNFQSSDYISVVGSSSEYIHSINAWTSKEITITVHVAEGAPDGTYEIPITCSFDEYYYNATQGYVTSTMTPTTLGIVFNVRGEIIIDVADLTTDPTEVRPGDDYVTVTATLSNAGEGQAKEVKAELECPDGFKPSKSSTNIAYIGILNSGSQSVATFHIDVEEGIEDGYYSLLLTITYKDTSNNDYTITKEVRLLVEPKPDFEVTSVRITPATIRSGDHVRLEITVKNTGSEDAKSVEIRAIRKATQPFDFDERSSYIGDLDIGDEGSGALTFDVETPADPREYLLKIRIRCTGDPDKGDYNVYTFDRTVSVTVSPGAPKHERWSGYGIIIGVIIVLAGGIYYHFRRRR